MKQILIPACIVLLFGAAVVAQARPDFSGTWVLDPKKPAASGGGGTTRVQGSGTARATLSENRPLEYRITQTDEGLTIERTAGDRSQKFVYTFDGAENVTVNNRTTTRSKSRWDGATLITEGTETVATSSGDISSKFREVRSLAPDGSMVVEITRTTEAGSSSTQRVYAKKK